MASTSMSMFCELMVETRTSHNFRKQLKNISQTDREYAIHKLVQQWPKVILKYGVHTCQSITVK